MTREDAAVELATDGFGKLHIEGNVYEDVDFFYVEAVVQLSRKRVVDYANENNLCDLADRRDAEDEERRMEG